MLDVLQPAGHGNLQGAFLAELRLEDLLRSGPPGGAPPGPVDAVRGDVRRVAALHDSRELAVQSGMLDTVRLRYRALRWLLIERSTRQRVEGLALVGAFRRPVVRLVERDGISVRRPGQHANVVPSFLEIDSVELQQRHGGVAPGHLPYLELARGADRSRRPGDDLHRDVVRTLYLLRVRGHLDGDAEATVSGSPITPGASWSSRTDTWRSCRCHRAVTSGYLPFRTRHFMHSSSPWVEKVLFAPLLLRVDSPTLREFGVDVGDVFDAARGE